MKFSELYDLINLAMESTPSEQSIIYGCDCGCGGDFYEDYSGETDPWEEAHEEIENARIKVREFCETNNIVIDEDRISNP